MSKTIGFNYEVLKREQRKTTRDHASAIHSILQRTSAGVAEIGRRLIDVHEQIGRNCFSAWLSAEFQWGQPVASNYMAVARNFGDLDCLNQFQPSALYLLGRRNIDPRAISEAIDRARNGEKITRKEAASIVAKFQPMSASTSLAGRPAQRPSDFLPQLRDLIQHASEQFSNEQRDALANELFALAARIKAASVSHESKPTVNPGRKPKKSQTVAQPA